jgi:hypothetical protein
LTCAVSTPSGSTLATVISAPPICAASISQTLASKAPSTERISGAFFPAELSADEIMLSVNPGTRMRYKK